MEEAWNVATASGDAAMEIRVLFQLAPMASRWLRVSLGLQAVVNVDPNVSAAGLDVLHRVLVDWNRGYPMRLTTKPELLREQFENARPVLRSLRSRDRRRFELCDEVFDLVGGKFAYLLENPSKSGVFGNAHPGAMGFAPDSLDTALRSHLVENFGWATASVPMTGGGMKFSVTGPLTGPNGNKWTVTTARGVDPDGTIRLITATP